MNSQSQGPSQTLGQLCRDLRLAKGLKQRQVAEAVGVATSTWGNVESSKFKVISEEKALRVADFFELTGALRENLLAASAAMPMSKYTLAQRERWKTKNAARSKDKRAALVWEALENLVCWQAAKGAQCSCTEATFDEDASVCPLCQAMHALGVTEGYGDSMTAMTRLATLYAAPDPSEAVLQ